LYIDSDGTKVAGDQAILRYLAQRSPDPERQGVEVLRGGDKLSDIDGLLAKWREFYNSSEPDFDTLTPWEQALTGQHYLGGNTLAIDDCAFWPVLREIVQKTGQLSDNAYPNLAQYYTRVGKRGIVRAVLEEMKCLRR
jgi:glutathione S-transferase